MVSKVQVSPRWLQNTPSMSNGVALKRSATAVTSDGWTNRNTAFGIDEAADQPGAGDAVDFGPRAGHPDRAALFVARRKLVGADQQLAGLLPGFETAFEGLRFDAAVAQPGGRALAELLALLADNDDGFAPVVLRPFLVDAVVAAHGARHQARVAAVIVIDAHIDDSRRLRKSDETGELSGGDCGD